MNTKAFADAIAALDKAGGGVLVVPEGNFLTGSFNLTSNMVLKIDGRITGSPNPVDYPIIPYIPSWGGSYYCKKGYWGGNWFNAKGARHQGLVSAFNVKNTYIIGTGSVYGNGLAWWKRCYNEGTTVDRPHMVQFQNSSSVGILGPVNFTTTPNWNTHFLYCHNVTIENAYFWQPIPPAGTCNTDGIDIDSSTSVLIRDVCIAVNDNTIALKSGLDAAGYEYARPVKNVLIENIRTVRGGAIAIGSDMSGGANNITIRNVYMGKNGLNAGCRVKTRRGRGGLVTNVTFDNFTVEGAPLFVIDMWYFCCPKGHPTCGDGVNCDKPVSPIATPKVRNIKVLNSRVINSGGQYLKGLPEQPITGVFVDNVQWSGKWGVCTDASGTQTKVDYKASCLNSGASGDGV